MRKSLGLIAMVVCGQVVAAGAPVEELSNNGYRSASQAAAPAVAPQAPNQALIDLHYDLQGLRDEVRQLRGIVEEQANELRELRQRQMDDYQDLDRRLSARQDGSSPTPSISSGAGMGASPAVSESQQSAQGANSGSFYSATAPSAGGSDVSSGVGQVQQQGDEQAEAQAYNATYNLLKARKIDEAVAGFTNLVAKYPNGKYTANAYYWLGEIYLLQNNLPQAENAFAMVTQNFPIHRKAADASFKLGKVYHQMGQTDKARNLLQQVANGNSSAAPLARAYLSDNF